MTSLEDLPDDVRQQLLAALQGHAPAIVCYSRCWACMFGQCSDPPRPHPWADDEDREHAAAMGRPEPTGNCACPCARPTDPAAGPTAREAADNDRRWPLEKAGE